MATVTELVTKFSFAGNLDPLTKYNKELGAAVKGLALVATATIGAAVAGAVWVGHILNNVDALHDISKATRTTVADIQALGYAAEQNGSSAEALQSSLKGLSNSVALAANGMGRGREVFEKFGIATRDASGNVRSAGDVLEELRQKFNQLGLSINERGALAGRLGLDPSLAEFLMLSDDAMGGLVKRAREMGVVTQEQADAAAEYNDALGTQRYAMSAIKNQIAVGLAPAMTELVTMFTELLIANKGWIVGGIKIAVEFIGQLLGVLRRVAPLLAIIGVAFLAAKVYTLGFAGAMAIAFSPVYVITAAIVALVLVVDDLLVAFAGGESLIGDFFKGFFGFDLSSVTRALQDIFEWVTKLISVLSGKIGKFLGFTGDGDINVNATKVIEVRAGEAAPISLPPKVTVSPKNDNVVATGDRNDNRRIEQNVRIEIKSTDPVASGRAAADGVQRQLKDANAQLGVGGR